jgi:hypothetical protein
MNPAAWTLRGKKTAFEEVYYYGNAGTCIGRSYKLGEKKWAMTDAHLINHYAAIGLFYIHMRVKITGRYHHLLYPNHGIFTLERYRAA